MDGMPMEKRFVWLAVASMGTCVCGSVIWAQSAPVPPPPPPDVQTRPPQSPAEAMERAGGSLLRATMSSVPDPKQAKLSNVSYFAVPQPEPRTLKKHDLV